MGGSFNPVHLGHLILAEEAMFLAGYTHVLLVPSFNPPHKAILDDPGAGARLEMLAAACAGDPSLLVDGCEVTRGGISYTIDTLRDIKTRYDLEGKPGLLIGDDLIPGFTAWREPGAIVREAEIICARRTSPKQLPFPFPHRYLENLLLPVSSSLVRARIASGRGFRRLVPEPVWKIIECRGYYRAR